MWWVYDVFNSTVLQVLTGGVIGFLASYVTLKKTQEFQKTENAKKRDEDRKREIRNLRIEIYKDVIPFLERNARELELHPEEWSEKDLLDEVDRHISHTMLVCSSETNTLLGQYLHSLSATEKGDDLDEQSKPGSIVVRIIRSMRAEIGIPFT